MPLTRDVLHAVTGRPIPAFRRVSLTILAAGFATALVLAIGPSRAHSSPLDPCELPVTNVVACENTLPGSPRSEWDITGAGRRQHPGLRDRHQRRTRADGRLQGQDGRDRLPHRHLPARATTAAHGARKIATVTPIGVAAADPAGLSDADAATGLVDCGNWAVSASWAVPADAVSGVYIAKLVPHRHRRREPHRRSSSATTPSHSDLLFQTSDTTWQAYNNYGGNSLYVGHAGRAAPTR